MLFIEPDKVVPTSNAADEIVTCDYMSDTFCGMDYSRQDILQTVYLKRF